MKPELEVNSVSATSKTKSWSWEKRHWLALIGLSCLLLWYLAPSLKESPLLSNAIGYLPIIGSLAFATDNLLKLTR